MCDEPAEGLVADRRHEFADSVEVCLARSRYIPVPASTARPLDASREFARRPGRQA